MSRDGMGRHKEVGVVCSGYSLEDIMKGWTLGLPSTHLALFCPIV